MAEDKKGFSLFKKQETATRPEPTETTQQITNIGSRLKLLESRQNDLNRRIEVTDKNMLNRRRIVSDEIKVINSDILELKRQINQLTNKLDMVIEEIKKLAAKEDIETIRKYVDMWEPVNFATRNEVEKIIEEKLSEK